MDDVPFCLFSFRQYRLKLHALMAKVGGMSGRLSTHRFLAGLQTGMAGALLMLGWLGLAMLWTRHSVWWYPNLMATTFGGDPALHTGYGRYSAAGLALHLTLYSVAGGVFAWLIPERTTPTRVLLFGMIWSLVVYYGMYGFVWKHLNPLIPLYSPDRPMLVAQVLYGFMLARLPRYTNASTADVR